MRRSTYHLSPRLQALLSLSLSLPPRRNPTMATRMKSTTHTRTTSKANRKLATMALFAGATTSCNLTGVLEWSPTMLTTPQVSRPT